MIQTLIEHNKDRLNDIQELLESLSDDIFTQSKQLITNATIGQHIRHVLEFYVCINNGVANKSINYDTRERNLLIESDINYALAIITQIRKSLISYSEDFELVMCANYSNIEGMPNKMNSSLSRELAFALEHTIHHMAIIKIVLNDEENKVPVSENFGVAASTIRHRNVCAQ